MILPILLLGLFVLEAGAGYVLTRIDLPRYRPLIFRLHVAGTITAMAAFAICAKGAHVILACAGLLFAAIGAARAWHFHSIRNEFDLPPALRASGDEPIGPDKKAKERRAARTR